MFDSRCALLRVYVFVIFSFYSTRFHVGGTNCLLVLLCIKILAYNIWNFSFSM